MTTLRQKNQWMPGLDYDWLPIWQPNYAPKNEIVPGVWVGGLLASKALRRTKGWTIICVREHSCADEPWAVHVPLLRKKTHWLAGLKALRKIAGEIDRAHLRGDKVLVHCWEGIERGPLSVAFWLCSRWGYSLDEAYALLKDKRPAVCDRRKWLTLAAADAIGAEPDLNTPIARAA